MISATQTVPSALSVEHVSVEMGGLRVLNNVSFSAAAGTLMGVVGPNGAGKTTFVNMVTGHLPPTAGTIEVLGESILGLPTRKITDRGLCRSFQVPLRAGFRLGCTK